MINHELTLILVHYNTPDAVISLVGSLAPYFPIVLVNNSPSLFPKQLPSSITIIESPQNPGFSHACNLGSAHAKTPWVLFLNPDIQISYNQINQLLEYAKKNADCVSPRLISSSRAILHSYHQPLATPWNILVQFSPLGRIFQPSKTTTILPGACLLIKKSLLTELKGWDERYWLWWEDADLSFKLHQHKIPYQIADDIQVIHEGGSSFQQLSNEQRKRIFFQSLNIYVQKNFSHSIQLFISKTIQRFSPSSLYPADPLVRVSIVIPNVNQHLLEQFLKNNFKYFSKHDEIIIVTSAEVSNDLRTEYSDVIWILLDENKGFAATVNVGIRRARGQSIFILNDDTILDSNWAENILTEHKNKLGSISPKITSPIGEIESLGIFISPQGRAYPNIDAHPRRSIDSFNGAAALLSREALEQVGLFDELFGSYLEDIDLGLRMKKRGFLHLIAPQAKIIHLKHQTSKKNRRLKKWQDVKNWWLVMLKNYSFFHWIFYGPIILIERIRNISGFLKTNDL